MWKWVEQCGKGEKRNVEVLSKCGNGQKKLGNW